MYSPTCTFYSLKSLQNFSLSFWHHPIGKSIQTLLSSFLTRVGVPEGGRACRDWESDCICFCLGRCLCGLWQLHHAPWDGNRSCGFFCVLKCIFGNLAVLLFHGLFFFSCNGKVSPYCLQQQLPVETNSIIYQGLSRFLKHIVFSSWGWLLYWIFLVMCLIKSQLKPRDAALLLSSDFGLESHAS